MSKPKASAPPPPSTLPTLSPSPLYISNSPSPTPHSSECCQLSFQNQTQTVALQCHAWHSHYTFHVSVQWAPLLSLCSSLIYFQYSSSVSRPPVVLGLLASCPLGLCDLQPSQFLLPSPLPHSGPQSPTLPLTLAIPASASLVPCVPVFMLSLPLCMAFPGE